MRRRLKRAAVLLTAVASVLLLVAVPASAAASSSAIVYTNGTRAAEAWFNRADGTHNNKAWIHLYDAKCDAKPVLVRWLISGKSQWDQWGHTGGCGTGTDISLQSGNFGISYRVCVGNWLGYTCSPIVYDSNP